MMDKDEKIHCVLLYSYWKTLKVKQNKICVLRLNIQSEALKLKYLNILKKVCEKKHERKNLSNKSYMYNLKEDK